MIYPANKASLMHVLRNILEAFKIDSEPLLQEAALNPGLMRIPVGR